LQYLEHHRLPVGLDPASQALEDMALEDMALEAANSKGFWRGSGAKRAGTSEAGEWVE
jgi:hypothetical protein